jgi:polyhydroxyalkanoate synthesis regulator protein
MANHYFDNIQHWVEKFLEEHIDSISNDKDELHEFIKHTLYSPHTLKEYVGNMFQECEQINNKQLLLAILNSVDWNQAKSFINEYIEFNIFINYYY